MLQRSHKIAGLWNVFNNLYGEDFAKKFQYYFYLYTYCWISEAEFRKYLVDSQRL